MRLMKVVADFAAFHESALNNASSVLKAQGKLKGVGTVPVSVQSF